MVKIMAATPVASTGAVEPECVYAITHQELNPDWVLDWEFERGHEVFIERNVLVRRAQQGGYSKILFVDSDVKIPTDALKHLMEHDADIVMGFTPMKNTKTGKYSIYRTGGYFDKSKCYMKDQMQDQPDLIEVKGGGFGCVLIDISVFDKIDPPWFVYTERKNGVRRGEDLHFCYQAEAAGIRIFADTRVICKHKRSDFE